MDGSEQRRAVGHRGGSSSPPAPPSTERETADVQDRLRRQRRANRRLRGLLIGVAAALVLALVAATVASNQWNEATDQTRQGGRCPADGRCRTACCAGATEVDDNLSRALLLAVEANRLEDGPTTRGSLQAALLHDPVPPRLPSRRRTRPRQRVRSAPTVPASRCPGATARFSSGTPPDDARRRSPPSGPGGERRGVQSCGRATVTADHDGTVSVFDVATGGRRWQTSVSGRPWGVVFSPDDRWWPSRPPSARGDG